ncbi:Fanconi anemia group F protein [Xyrauchen texanus]|uniref:Fanconi anemia group F protein n=1 Tax=Xyrauchen texanus TaxID=154827 RepID=UPI0022420CA4|nr:Fanconi anemia group F protein [Xyrauchen texanus]
MESVLGHLQHILELLAVSQTDCVNEWDYHTTLKAFQWAEYCEHLHNRFHANPAVRPALESRLHDTNRHLRETFPSYSPVMLSELAQCQHKLLINLLRNPSAPSSIVQRLFPDSRPTEQGLKLDQNGLITCKSAFKLLCCSLETTSSAGLQVEAEVRGKLLGKLLNSILTRPGNDDYARTLLESILCDSAGNMESLNDVIASVLLSSDDGTNSVTQRFILDWLQSHDGCFSKLCESLSPGLCRILSTKSVEFKEAYWGVLKQWASCLEYDVLQSVWVLTSDGTVTFNVLADRLRDLLKTGSPLKQETETQLAELKLESGAFDVKGISVWTDLIIQLKL